MKTIIIAFFVISILTVAVLLIAAYKATKFIYYDKLDNTSETDTYNNE